MAPLSASTKPAQPARGRRAHFVGQGLARRGSSAGDADADAGAADACAVGDAARRRRDLFDLVGGHERRPGRGLERSRCSGHRRAVEGGEVAVLRELAGRVVGLGRDRHGGARRACRARLASSRGRAARPCDGVHGVGHAVGARDIRRGGGAPPVAPLEPASPGRRRRRPRWSCRRAGSSVWRSSYRRTSGSRWQRRPRPRRRRNWPRRPRRSLSARGRRRSRCWRR